MVNLAEEANLARKGVEAPSHAILSICKSPIIGGVAGVLRKLNQIHDQSLIVVSLGLSISVDSQSAFSCFAHKGSVGDAVIVLLEFLNIIERQMEHNDSLLQMSAAHLIQPHPHPRYTKPIHYPIQMSRGDYYFYKSLPVPQPYMQTFEMGPVKLELALWIPRKTFAAA